MHERRGGRRDVVFHGRAGAHDGAHCLHDAQGSYGARPHRRAHRRTRGPRAHRRRAGCQATSWRHEQSGGGGRRGPDAAVSRVPRRGEVLHRGRRRAGQSAVAAVCAGTSMPMALRQPGRGVTDGPSNVRISTGYVDALAPFSGGAVGGKSRVRNSPWDACVRVHGEEPSAECACTTRPCPNCRRSSAARCSRAFTGFDGIGILVDVGGGIGTNLGMITSKYKNIKGINFDLPFVVRQAKPIPGVQHIGGTCSTMCPAVTPSL
ncbi:hypothetical protein HU200_000387 [Digitaria exilis]|uniref:O-methyltransferase C-terminal domain-containing protein n=1 Tax=Digitaria exilis TaxID=1010633 RepID=A0A835FYZ4_9POAL|nr:hypothetical protein HU200_000387 [Digitaria exilis]